MKAEERETVLDLVEGLVVRGYDRPGEIAKNLGINRNTAARYLRIVLGRITGRTKPAESRSATRGASRERQGSLATRLDDLFVRDEQQ